MHPQVESETFLPHFRRVVFLLVVVQWFSSTAKAADAVVTIYTDRFAWEADVDNFLFDDFNSAATDVIIPSSSTTDVGLFDVTRNGGSPDPDPRIDAVPFNPDGAWPLDGTTFLSLEIDEDTGFPGDNEFTTLTFEQAMFGFAADLVRSHPFHPATSSTPLTINVAGATIDISAIADDSVPTFIGFTSTASFSSLDIATTTDSVYRVGLDNIAFAPFQADADGNRDGWVDGLDYLLWAAHFGDAPAEHPPGFPGNGDFDNNCVVEGLDYLVWAGQFASHSAGIDTPEPANGGLLLVGGGLCALTTSRATRRPSTRRHSRLTRHETVAGVR